MKEIKSEWFHGLNSNSFHEKRNLRKKFWYQYYSINQKETRSEVGIYFEKRLTAKG